MFTLKNICLSSVACMIFRAWNFKSTEKITTMDIAQLKMQTKDYFRFPFCVLKAILDLMFLKWGNLSIGHAIWMLESGCPVLNLWFWCENLNMADLSTLTSEEGRNNLQELLLARPVKNIHAISTFKNLKTLILDRNMNTSKELIKLLSTCPNIVNLSMENCMQLRNKFFQSLVKTKCLQNNLRHLHISNTSASSRMATTILKRLPLLESFSFHNVFGLLQIGLKKEIGKKIQNLSLGHAKRPSSFSRRKKIVSPLQMFVCLRRLELILPYDCKISALKEICKDCVFLESFTLSFFSSQEDLTNLPKRSFRDVVTALFSTNDKMDVSPMNQLKLISVQHVELNLLFFKLPNLIKLHLENCSICSEYERWSTQSLLRLHVDNIRTFDVREILMRCPYLEVLEFSNIPLKSAMFSGIKLPYLKKFSVYQCVGHQLHSVNIIMTYFPKYIS